MTDRRPGPDDPRADRLHLDRTELEAGFAACLTGAIA
jgi:hypothetical protein